MTTDPRRALAALALVPMTAGAFAGTVAWAADRPAQTASTDLAPVTAPPAQAVPSGSTSTSNQGLASTRTTSPGATLDPRVAAVAEQLDVLRARLAALQAELAAQSEQAAQEQVAQAQAAAPRAQRTAPAPRPAPPVDTTTRASG